MTTPNRRNLLLSAAAIMAAVAVACGGGSNGSNQSSPVASPASSAVQGDATTPQADSTDQGNSSVAPGLDALKQLHSYRYHVTVDLGGATPDETIAFDQTGAFVAPDRSTAKCNGSFGPLAVAQETIGIGTQIWTKTGTAANFQPTTDATSLSCVFTPEAVFATFKNTDFSPLKGSKEAVNGVQAVRYDLDEALAKQMIDLKAELDSADLSNLPANRQFTFSIWFAQDGGFPVRELFDVSANDSGTAYHYKREINITNVNDESIQVNPP